MISRRGFLAGIVGSAAVSTLNPQSIDREALVRRHNPVLRQLDPLSPLSLGKENAMPLCTMSQWGWHTKPFDLDARGLRLTQYDTHGRVVGYQTSSEGQADLFNWLRIDSVLVSDGTSRVGLAFPYGSPAMQAADWQQPLMARL